MSCQATTKSGQQCRRKAIANNRCTQHNRCQATTKTGHQCKRKGRDSWAVYSA